MQALLLIFYNDKKNVYSILKKNRSYTQRQNALADIDSQVGSLPMFEQTLI